MLAIGKAEKLMDGTDVIIIAAGPLANRACEASARYRTMTGANPAIYNIRYIKPIDTGLLESAGATFRTVITLEDGVTAGGLYGAVCEYFSNKADRPEIIGMGIPDRFIEQGTQAEEMKECGIDTDSIFRRIKEEMEKTDKKSQKVLESRN